MVKLQVTLLIWEANHAKIMSIQGEAGSRMVEVTFADKSGAPVDLTGCTPRMVVDNGAPEPPMNDGTIVDAAGGIADFTVTSDMLTRPGDWPCEFALTGQNFPLLKANGLMLHVDASSTESAIGSTNELASLWVALNKVDTAAEQAAQITQETAQALADVQTGIQELNTAKTNTEAATTNANNAATAAKNLPYVGSDGYWYTYDTTTAAYVKTDVVANGMPTVGINYATGNLEMYTIGGYSAVNFNLNQDTGELELII